MASEEPRSRVSRILGQYIIKYQFQFKYSLYLLATVTVVGFILWFEAHLAISRMLNADMIPNPDTAEQLRLIAPIIGKTIILLMGLTFGGALMLSHFIAGPVYRFERIFQEIQEGNLGMIVRLRPKDDFQDTADKLNMALSGLRNKIQKERESTLGVVGEFVKILTESGRSAEADKLKKLIEGIYSDPKGIKISL